MAKSNASVPEKGAKVHLTLASGKHAEATITGVRGKGLIDLVADVSGQEVIITSSPLDEEGKKADSWHWPESEEAKAEK